MFKSISILRFVKSTSSRFSLTWLLKSFHARNQSNAVIGKTKLAFSLVFETSIGLIIVARNMLGRHY